MSHDMPHTRVVEIKLFWSDLRVKFSADTFFGKYHEWQNDVSEVVFYYTYLVGIALILVRLRKKMTLDQLDHCVPVSVSHGTMIW